MDRRDGSGASAMTFINEGFLHNESMVDGLKEQPLSASSLRELQNGLPATNRRYDSAYHNRHYEDNSRRIISAGIREYACENLGERTARGQPQNPTKPKFYNCCIIFSTIVLLLAPIAISAYVFIKHERFVRCDSHSEGPSVYPSMQQSGNDNSELKKLVDEVKELHTKYQKLQIRVGQSSSGESIREQRERRYNCSSQASKSQAASLDGLRNKFTKRARQIQTQCMRKLKDVDSKVRGIETELTDATSNCIFKLNNNTKVDNVKNIQKVQINGSKNANAQLVGVTCCNEYNAALNVSNAILQVNETASTIVYECYCAVGQKCNICYWECGDTRHRSK